MNDMEQLFIVETCVSDRSVWLEEYFCINQCSSHSFDILKQVNHFDKHYSKIMRLVQTVYYCLTNLL